MWSGWWRKLSNIVNLDCSTHVIHTVIVTFIFYVYIQGIWQTLLSEATYKDYICVVTYTTLK